MVGYSLRVGNYALRRKLIAIPNFLRKFYMNKGRLRHIRGQVNVVVVYRKIGLLPLCTLTAQTTCWSLNVKYEGFDLIAVDIEWLFLRLVSILHNIVILPWTAYPYHCYRSVVSTFSVICFQGRAVHKIFLNENKRMLIHAPISGKQLISLMFRLLTL